MGYHLGAAADTGCYRFKSERRRIRDKKQHADKQLLKLDRELDSLSLQRRNLPMVELTPPVQRGWVRYFVLRDDVARSKYAAFFEGILAKINTKEYYYRKNFVKRKRRKGKKQFGTEDQHIRKLEEYEFRKSGFTEKEKLYFEERLEMNSCRKLRTVYVFKERWRFILVVKPNMITRIKPIDPLLEASIQSIRNQLDRKNLWGRFYKAKGKRRDLWRGYYPKPKEKHEYKNTPLHAILGMIEADACTDQNELI